jgi:thioredoxin reductase (NADPH)
MAASPHETDIVIIGAGPVGLFAVFQCGMLGLKSHVVDALDMIGGQCQALYPEKPIYDIPAWPKITGEELIAQLTQQAAPFAPVYHLGHQVLSVEKTDTGWKVLTTKETVIHCKAVIIAAGAGAFGPNRPPLAGLEEYENKSVFYYIRKREDFAGKNIVIAGGGDSAVDWAVSLADIAAKIYVVHRRDDFRAAPDSVSKMHDLTASGKIEMVIPYQLSGLNGKDGRLKQVIVKTLKGEERIIEADTLLPFFGLAMNLGPIAEWNLELQKHQIKVNPATQATNQAGIFAIGDMAQYDGKLKLILQGFSEAAVAAHAIYHHIYPDKILELTHSTDKGVPGIK